VSGEGANIRGGAKEKIRGGSENQSYLGCVERNNNFCGIVLGLTHFRAGQAI